MSRRWNPFKLKKTKADSDGTTAANEELQFQPTMGHETNAHLRVVSNLAPPLQPLPMAYSVNGSQLTAGVNELTASTAQLMLADNLSQHNYENSDCLQQFPTSGVNCNDKEIAMNGRIHLLDAGKPAQTIANTHGSPRPTKKLIKPGNSEQRIEVSCYLNTTSDHTNIVGISDEYTDPYDAISGKESSKKFSAAEGYIEPFEAQQMYQDATDHSNIQHNNGDSRLISSETQKNLYDDPWDNSKQQRNNQTDYEEPWDNNDKIFPLCQTTDLISNQQQSNGNTFWKLREVENPSYQPDSGDSLTSSSSAASLVKQHMVRVEARNSPSASPRSSPHLDRRLIKPVETSSQQLYSKPRHHVRERSFDKRLVKAEPSLEELRQASAQNSSRGSSANCSPNRSPMGTMAGSMIERLSGHNFHRGSSPLLKMQHSNNASFRRLSKVKSRSLDMRNTQGGRYAFPKSASDDQLAQQSDQFSMARQNNLLSGVVEYEEPWDHHENQLPSVVAGVQRHHAIIHSRSRSQEVTGFCPPPLTVMHEKSQSYDKPVRDVHPDYERPWDRHKVPDDDYHFKSMQRFQQRKLELHPSEAINDRDFNPLHPLHRQNWFHGNISRDEAILRLEREEEGSYLVRNSESIPNNFSLSLRTSNDIIHMVISRTRDGFWILGEFSAPFHSIPEMIVYYSSHRLKINDFEQMPLCYPVHAEYL